MNKILCPYCGSEMKIEWEDFDFCAYTCPRCNSKAPRGDSIEDAEEKALQRPLQKPLTLEEACESEEPCVYIEKKEEGIFAAHVRHYENTMLYSYAKRVNVCAVTMFCRNELFENQEYNKTWRCWATKPTDEEREAAKWG